MIIVEVPATANPEPITFPKTLGVKPRIHVLGHAGEDGPLCTGARSIGQEPHFPAAVPLTSPPATNVEAAVRVLKVVGDYSKTHGLKPTHVLLLTLNDRVVGVAAMDHRPHLSNEDKPPLDSPHVLVKPGLTKGIRPDWPKP